MATEYVIDYLPLWGVFIATVGVVLISVAVGYGVGRYEERHSGNEHEPAIGAIVGATLGLLAFLLAFTFGVAASRFDVRKQLVLDDANAIGTSYLRAKLLSEPYATEIRKLLREYVDIRVEGIRQEKLQSVMARSEELHHLLWSQAIAFGEKNPTSIVGGLFIQSLNQVIDLHAKRVAAGRQNRIPGTIWVVLYVVTGLAMALMGYHAALAGVRRTTAIVLLSLAFSAVIFLIADLDRPLEGLLKVSQEAMADVRESILRDLSRN